MNRHRSLAGRALRGGLASLLSLSMVLSASASAFAADPAAPAAAPPAPVESPEAKAPSAQVKEATTRFERGLALFDDGDLDAALVEFTRAYDLSPTYKILYNIAKIERAKNDYSSALTHFQHYLDQGGAEVPADRRDEVQKEIGVLKDRVALVTVKANVEGAVVYIDDVPVCSGRTFDRACSGTTPLSAPLVVNPGKRKVTASKQGYQNAYAQLTVAGGDTNTVKLDLFDLRPRAVNTAPRDRAIVAWSVTGALAIGAGVMGVLALGKKSNYDDDAGKPLCANQTINSNNCNTDTAAKLSSDKSATRTFAAITDVLAGAAIVGAGVSIYLTAKAAGQSEPEQHAGLIQNLRLTAGPGTAVLDGRF